MEELQLLVEMVASLPQAAIWVLVLFFCYKTFIIGSIYGIIRLGITMLHSWATKPKQIDYILGSKIVSERVKLRLESELTRLTSTGNYIHMDGVETLSTALDLASKYSHEQLKDAEKYLANKPSLSRMTQ